MKTRIAKAAVIFLALLSSPGCSYFRWSEPSYQEMHDRAQQKTPDEGTYKPGEPGGPR
jgi:hypothetical protein